MDRIEVKIIIESSKKYSYKIFLYYPTEETAHECLWIPLDKVAQGSTEVVISAPQGIILDTYRHFKSDYIENTHFKMTVPEKKVSFSNVSFSYEDDNERNIDVVYDNWFIKNLLFVVHN